ncbi:MAG: ArsB/NhaD family transporter [Planctomycetes bacterium]|nr:ArsB/NhaD family transporter [Planctomycetota bacterium]
MYWLATAIFVVAFAAIVSERVHKTKVALVGAATMIVLPILTQNEAFHSTRFGVDYNVIFLLISMMIMINIIARSGVFEWTAIKAAKLGRGYPFRIMAIFIALTAVSSAFLDNVTTVLLLAPVTLLIADELDIDPVPFLIAEALASNVGGTATLIGDPPNIIIASRAELSFVDFIVHLTPVVVVILVGFMLGCKLFFGGRLKVADDKRQRMLAMDASGVIKDKGLAVKSLVVLGLTLVGFTLHGVLDLEPATIALLGASVLLLISRIDPHGVLSEVEWPTIFFFIGLFIMVGGIVKVGVIRDVSEFVIRYTEPTAESMRTTSFVVLWASGILSALVDNIPYVATMSPLILDTANTVFHGGQADPGALPHDTLHHAVLMPVWWSLALGSCLGGNGTPIGASANVIVLGIAERSGIVITFLRFMAFGIPTMLFTLVVSHVYILLRYY